MFFLKLFLFTFTMQFRSLITKKNVGTMDEWRTMLDVNVLSLQLCTQLAIKSMLKVLLSVSLLFFVKTHEPFLQTSRAEEK